MWVMNVDFDRSDGRPVSPHKRRNCGQQKRDHHGRFLTGNIGGPGRPKGSRNKLSEEFLLAVYDDWSKHGGAVLARVREIDPAAYLRMVASLVPARLDVTTEDANIAAIDNMTADELRAFIASPLEEIGISEAAGAPRDDSNKAKAQFQRRAPVGS
jgi:hypothetical protein